MPSSKRYTYKRRRALTAALLVLAASSSLAHAQSFKLEEASIADIIKALDTGAISSVELTALYLARVAAYDRHGPRLNAIPVLNPNAFAEAAAADAARARGEKAPLLGILA